MPKPKPHNYKEITYGKKQCTRCKMRSHWPGAEDVCRGKESYTEGYDEDRAKEILLAEVREFFRWWEHEYGGAEQLPTMNDWGAEFHEWRKK